MANIKQSDVASTDQTSGSSIAKAAETGKLLPVSALYHVTPDPPDARADGIEPNNGNGESAANQGKSKVSVKAKTSELSGDSEQIRNRTIASAVTELNDFVQNEKRDLEFVVKDEAGVSVVRVTNRKSGELIRQIPGDEVIDLARKLNDQEPLRLFSAQV
jgi:flagellar protein FlaG